VHLDPIGDRREVHAIAADPPARAVRTARQAELVPPASLRSARGDRENDAKLSVRPETGELPNGRRVIARRGADERGRLRQLSCGGQPHRLRVRRSRGGPDHDPGGKADRKQAEHMLIVARLERRRARSGRELRL
jgi:hypothetical protein